MEPSEPLPLSYEPDLRVYIDSYSIKCVMNLYKVQIFVRKEEMFRKSVWMQQYDRRDIRFFSPVKIKMIQK